MKVYWGSAVVLSALMLSAAILEINGKETGGLWLIIVLWLLFGDFEDRGAK